MNNTDKLLRAFIEASGFEIEEVVNTTTAVTASAGIDILGVWPGSIDVTTVDYKVTKPETIMQHPVEFAQCDGDLFSLGCQVANDDIRGRLKLLGFKLDKNQMHDVMETIIFHVARKL